MIELKFQDAFPLKNHMHVIMANNSEWVVPVGIEERRFFVLDVSDDRRMDTDYFGAIVKQMDNAGHEALLYELQNREITANLWVIPRTEALYDQMVSSMDNTQKCWLWCLYAEKIANTDASWPKQLTKEKVFNSYQDYCNREDIRHRAHYKIFFKQLYNLCPTIQVTRPRKGNRERLLNFPYIEQARQLLETKIDIKVDWKQESSLLLFFVQCRSN